jgi:hypothetical protein
MSISQAFLEQNNLLQSCDVNFTLNRDAGCAVLSGMRLEAEGGARGEWARYRICTRFEDHT